MKEALVVSPLVPGAVLALQGRLDVRTVSHARELLHRAVDEGSGTMVLDFSGVDLLDAAGLGMLIGTQRRAQRAGRRLVLRDTPTRIRRLLRATRLERVLPTVASEPSSPTSSAASSVASSAAPSADSSSAELPAPRRSLTPACSGDAG